MSKSNQKKSEQLGIPHGTAQNKLRKKILFHLMQKCGMDTCFQCGEKIESIDKLSIEHKKPWLDSDDPVGLFFDLDNIAFSHLYCNRLAARSDRPRKLCPSIKAYEKRGCRCDECRTLKAEKNRRYRNQGPVAQRGLISS